MNRELLFQQVKGEYARLASLESRQGGLSSVYEPTPEMYYEKLTQQVLDQISAGAFDSFHSGKEVIEAVANNKEKWLPHWK